VKGTYCGPKAAPEREKIFSNSDILTQSRTKVGHFLNAFLTVPQAAKMLGVSAKTVTRWCETGKLPARPKQYGSKLSFEINRQAVEMFRKLLEEEEQRKQEELKANIETKAHRELFAPWIESLEKGLLTGKVFSQRTIKSYDAYITRFFKKHNKVSVETVKATLSSFPPEYYASRDKAYKALVCFAKYLIQEGSLDPGFLELVKPLCPKRHLPPRRSSVDDTGLDALLNACQFPLDTLIITLLTHTGIRATEACQVKIEDVNLEKGILTIRCGKGGKARRVGLSQPVIDAILAYRETLPAKSAGDFLLLNKEGFPMNRHSLYKRIYRVAEKAGVKAHPHALRRAFVTHNANKGRPLQMLQLACGHSNIKTTMGYCMTSEQDVVEAMKLWQ
jgi:integrase/recombinase XerD